MTYRGYACHAEPDSDTGKIYGRLSLPNDVVTFQAEDWDKAEREFHESVDDYLDFCAQRNEAPEESP